MRVGRVTELIQRSRSAQRLYALFADARSVRGNRYQRLAALLQAQRYLPADVFGDRRRRRVDEMIETTCRSRAIGDNLLLADFLQTPDARRAMAEFGGFPEADRVRLRFPRDDRDPGRQGNLLLLRPHDPATGDKGVLLVKYNPAILALPAVFDLPRLAARYALVLEPSWWGYQDVRFLLYVGSDIDVIVQAQDERDHRYIEGLRTNLVALRLGAGDWCDPDVFRPGRAEDKCWDLVMLAAWDPLKRHDVVLRAASELVAAGRDLRIALIGYPLTWDRTRIEALVQQSGLENRCRVFESIPHERVAEIIARSRVSLMMSAREGASKAIYESMFCDTPVILHEDNVGVNREHVNAMTGRFAAPHRLAEVLAETLDNIADFRPRQWALEHTGCQVATETLSNALGKRIVIKKNAPNLRYLDEADRIRLEPCYEALVPLLRPGSDRTNAGT